MFSRAQLLPDEVEPVRAAGGVVFEHVKEDANDEAFLQFPCALWQDHRCSVYGVAQPRTCNDYECKLLKRFIARDATLDECIEVVHTVRAAEGRLAAAGGPPELNADDQALGELGEQQRAALVAAIELDVLVKRHLKEPAEERNDVEP
jgi:hypothetical protein